MDRHPQFSPAEALEGKVTPQLVNAFDAYFASDHSHSEWKKLALAFGEWAGIRLAKGTGVSPVLSPLGWTIVHLANDQSLPERVRRHPYKKIIYAFQSHNVDLCKIVATDSTLRDNVRNGLLANLDPNASTSAAGTSTPLASTNNGLVAKHDTVTSTARAPSTPIGTAPAIPATTALAGAGGSSANISPSSAGATTRASTTMPTPTVVALPAAASMASSVCGTCAQATGSLNAKVSASASAQPHAKSTSSTTPQTPAKTPAQAGVTNPSSARVVSARQGASEESTSAQAASPALVTTPPLQHGHAGMGPNTGHKDRPTSHFSPSCHSVRHSTTMTVLPTSTQPPAYERQTTDHDRIRIQFEQLRLDIEVLGGMALAGAVTEGAHREGLERLTRIRDATHRSRGPESFSSDVVDRCRRDAVFLQGMAISGAHTEYAQREALALSATILGRIQLCRHDDSPAMAPMDTEPPRKKVKTEDPPLEPVLDKAEEEIRVFFERWAELRREQGGPGPAHTSASTSGAAEWGGLGSGPAPPIPLTSANTPAKRSHEDDTS